MSSPIAPDPLVRDYLAAVDRALVGLPDDRRGIALNDLRERIAAECAARGRGAPGPAADGSAGAATRAVLDRLGDPGRVAAKIWRREAGQIEDRQFESRRSEESRGGTPRRDAGPDSSGARRTLTTPTHAWPAITSPTLNAPIVASVDASSGPHRSAAVLWASVTVGVVVLVLIGVVIFALLA